MILPERPPSQADVDRFVGVNGYVFGLVLPRPVSERVGYQVAFVVSGAAGGGQIAIGGLSAVEGVYERYSYADVMTAISAYAMWEANDFADEPLGWVRHVPSNRRRTYSSCCAWNDYVEEVRK